MIEAAASSAQAAPEKRAETLVVRGVVQGVGFRPHVHRLATSLGLEGTVANGPLGVEVFVQGRSEDLGAFARALVDRAPMAAVIEEVERIDAEVRPIEGFHIVESLAAFDRGLAIGPDLATCEACLTELLDPADRRHRYPFLNCTDCGPRYTIALDLPYDRPNTSMRGFAMCELCRAEYDDPDDRRFHAQPNACPECGPTLGWVDVEPSTEETGSDAARGEPIHGDDALLRAVEALRAGRIVAVQGLGGFHLMVRADDPAAIARLRERKRRGDKPFAVMFESVDDVRDRLGSGVLSDEEADLLRSPAAPIVLVRTAQAERGIDPLVAPASPDLGCFVAATPLHHLLLRDLGTPVVATSGNERDEPIAIGPSEARVRLAEIADAFLVHDRPIVRPIDDSIVRVIAGEPMILRRARGYAPLAFEWERLPSEGVDLALGPHLKSTVGVRVGRRVVLSPHIGDLETVAAREFHERAARDLQTLVGQRADRVVCDRHPDYASTQLAERWVVNPIRVQHHEAHVWAVALEHRLEGPFLGVAWDGTGFGDDGTVWGGEFFAANGGDLARIGSFELFPLPGGERAVREPWRSALGVLEQAFGDDAPEALVRVPRAFAGAVAPSAWDLSRRIARGSAPQTSSVGRLFDAVGAILGLTGHAAYEAEAAQRLEHLAAHQPEAPRYPVDARADDGDGPWRISARAWLAALADDLAAGVPVARVAARFHATLAHVVASIARRVGAEDVVLTGGCFQNRVLLEQTIALLRADGRRPIWPRRIPPGDGGIAVGQLVAAARSQGLVSSKE
ncbi:MAG: carbamoyltransferase HypF [Planctomycetota bacterium]